MLAPTTKVSFKKSFDSYKVRFRKSLSIYIKKAKNLDHHTSFLNLPVFIYCKQSKVSAGSLLSYYTGDNKFDTKALLLKHKMQSLIVTGSQDTIVPNLAKYFFSISNNDHIHVEEIEDADHMFLDFFCRRCCR